MPCTGDDDSQVREHLRTWDTNSLTVKRMPFQVRRVLRTLEVRNTTPGTTFL